MAACRVADAGSNPARTACDVMNVILKLDKGTTEKLLEWKELKTNQSKNLTGKELTFELNDEDVVIQIHKNKMLEIADVNGSFGLWLKLHPDRLKKLKNIVKDHK